MTLFNCNCRCTCTAAALVASLIVGVLTAFFQITGIVTATTVFLLVVLGVALVYLGVLVVATALSRRTETCGCLCPALNAVLAGILGTVGFALVLLAVGVTATSVLSAILVGILLFFSTLTLASTACLVRCFAGCGS